MKLVALFFAILVTMSVHAQEEIQIESSEEYAPLISLTKWSRGGAMFWWKMVIVQDDADAALAEVRLGKSLTIHYRVEYPCFDAEGNILPHVHQTVVWQRGDEMNGTFTDCGESPVQQEVPHVATELLGVPPEFYIWGVMQLSGIQ